MAKSREAPYIWVTWLSKVMSGDTTCHWQSWFRSQNQLTEEQPSDFDLAGWVMNHTRMLTEFEKESIKQGYSTIKEKPIKYKVPNSNIIISGKLDCVIEKNEIIVYDCKTGKERLSDQVQVMIYMYLLSNTEPSKKQIKGVVMYKDKKIEIPYLPKDFEENFNFFVDILSSQTPPTKNPGNSCRFCKITKNDCPERVDKLEW